MKQQEYEKSVPSKARFQPFVPCILQPYIHFCTIRDFVILCNDLGIKIEKRLAINPAGNIIHFTGFGGTANLLAEQGIFLLSR